MGVTPFTGELDVRFLRPDDPALAFLPERKRRRPHAMFLDHLVWEIDYTGEPLPTRIEDLDPQRYVVMERGFVFDGVSSPRPAWWILPPWGTRAMRPAALHDKLLRLLEQLNPHPRFRTRRSIDAVFYPAMLAVGYQRWFAYGAWLFVRSWSLLRRVFPKTRAANKESTHGKHEA